MAFVMHKKESKYIHVDVSIMIFKLAWNLSINYPLTCTAL